MAFKFQDYYQTLEVSRTASADEIKQSFRRLARVSHPDVAKDKVKGEARFKEINEAYEVLGDPEKRRRYDELERPEAGASPGRARPNAREGAARETAGNGPEYEYAGTGFSDFFESFFSGGRGRGAYDPGYANGHVEPQQGQDAEADLLVTLEEVLNGSTRKVTLSRPEVDGVPGRVATYNVRIPRGVNEGLRMRLGAQGGAGEEGGAPGDLYLRVVFAKHPDFTIQGSDLFCDLNVAPWEAVLGASLKLASLDGTVSLRVPASSATASVLRLRGLGLPRADLPRGDLFVTLRIQMPTTYTEKELTLWRQLGATSAFQPRDEK